MKKIVRYEICLVKPNTDIAWYYTAYNKEDIAIYITHAIEHGLDVRYVKGMTK